MCSVKPGAESLERLCHPSLSLAIASGWSQARADRYSEAPEPWWATVAAPSVREEFERRFGPGSRRKALEGESPWEHPAVGNLNPCRPPGTLGRVETQEPRLVWAGPSPSGGGSTGGQNGRWVHPGGNTPDTCREGNAPKGESQERRRCETEPARHRREKTVRRVIKP
jgi:hypothetical protein